MVELSLTDFDWFRDFSTEHLDQLKRLLIRRRYTPGQLIFDREDISSDLFLMTDGRALAVFWSADGREIVYNRMSAGEVFGELSAIDNAPRSLSIYAQTECTALVLPQANFWQLIDSHATFRMHVLTSVTARVRKITEKCRELTTHSVTERVRSLLLHLALEQGEFHAGGILRDAPTHAEIGNTIGANREAVSRVLSDLKKRGIVKTRRGKITLCDPQALAADHEIVPA